MGQGQKVHRRVLPLVPGKRGEIPLPGTGAWTGTLAASMLNLDFRKSVLYVLLGVLLAGAIMLAASLGVFGAISFLK